MSKGVITGYDIKLPARPVPAYGYGDVVYNGAFTFGQMQQYARAAVVLNLTPSPTDRQIIDAFAPYREFPVNWIANFGRDILAL